MNKFLIVILSGLICIVSMLQNMFVSAINETFDMDEISYSQMFLDFQNTMHTSDDEIIDHEIQTFDIAENGDILICFTDGTFNIYDSNSNFNYKYSGIFRLENSQFTVAFWYQDHVCIYFARGEKIILLNAKGEIEKAYQLKSTVENSKIYREFMHKGHYSTSEYDYLLKRTFYETSLIQKDKKTGNEVMIYRFKKCSMRDLIFILVVWILIVIIILRKLKTLSNRKEFVK
ncbi:MAG: hypothetical protein K2O42_02100 [Oscillospiraceae bacterium]|nr:hypothetical protein [Oscillospiraceae bacterium]